MLDRVKLVKLLNLTQSQATHEALAAARAANKMLAAEGVTWDDVINGGPRVRVTVITNHDDLVAEALRPFRRKSRD
jgi:hypothetical protein